MTAALITVYVLLFAAVGALAVYEHSRPGTRRHQRAGVAVWAFIAGAGVETVVYIWLLSL